MTEAQLQSKVIKWLKLKGLYVIKTSPGAGTPVGCPDVIGLMDGGGWIGLECKKDAKSRFQPLQRETIEKLNNMYYCRAVWEDSWEEVKKELVKLI